MFIEGSRLHVTNVSWAHTREGDFYRCLFSAATEPKHAGEAPLGYGFSQLAQEDAVTLHRYYKEEEDDDDEQKYIQLL